MIELQGDWLWNPPVKNGVYPTFFFEDLFWKYMKGSFKREPNDLNIIKFKILLCFTPCLCLQFKQIVQ
jgi:hypothetical protein